MDVKYEDRIVAAISILGFQEYLSDEGKCEQVGAILRLPYIFKENETARMLKIKGIVMTSLSEHLLISVALKERDGMDKIVKILSVLTRTLLSEFGLMLRGSIAVGKLCHDAQVVYGSALQKADKFERTLAVYPRIIMEYSDFERSLQSCRPNVQASLRDGFRLENDGFLALNSFRYWDCAVLESCLATLRETKASDESVEQNQNWMKSHLQTQLDEKIRSEHMALTD